MQKSNALLSLLESLREEDIQSEVEVHTGSKALLHIDEDAASDSNAIVLDADDCLLLFADTATAEQFLDVLPEAQDASITLFDVVVPGAVLELLERSMAAVDEG